MSYAFHTADVFTDHLHGGNPLAVIPDARGLSDAQMQAITREFNYSETVFVFPPDHEGAHAQSSAFSPPTVSSRSPDIPPSAARSCSPPSERFRSTGGETESCLEEGVGPIPVLIRARDGKPVFASSLQR